MKACITGASSGIGLASAKLFASYGARLSLAARSLDKLEAVAKEIGTDNVLCVKTDVSVEADCRNLIEQTVSRFGRIDILVNNAGLSMRALFRDLDGCELLGDCVLHQVRTPLSA